MIDEQTPLQVFYLLEMIWFSHLEINYFFQVDCIVNTNGVPTMRIFVPDFYKEMSSMLGTCDDISYKVDLIPNRVERK